MSQLQAETVARIIQPVIAGERIQLCGIRIGGKPQSPIIKLFVDYEETNITVDACAAISKQVHDLLALSDDMPDRYSLEVSSPGIDWPLTEIWQFRKNIERRVRFSHEGIQTTGRIVGVTDSSWIRLETEEGVIEQPLSMLAGARIEIEIPKKHMKHKRKNK